jgi:hypothetical protein
MPTTKSGKNVCGSAWSGLESAVKSAEDASSQVREAVDAGDVAKAEAELRLAAKRPIARRRA